MWPFPKREARSADIDVGALFASFFGFGGTSYSWSISPAIIAASLANPGGTSALLTESRRLARVSPLLVAYVRCMCGGILTGEPERPTWPEGAVPERIAGPAADLWLSGCDPDHERELLLRVIVDGELLILPDGTVVPADGYDVAMAGPEWGKTVRGYKLGTSGSVRRDVFYLGDRRHGDERAIPWVGPALPYASALTGIRVAAGHGLQALAKIAAVIESIHPDRLAAAPAGRSGVVQTTPNSDNVAGQQDITSTGVGSVVYLRQNEKIGRIEAGPDETARKYESELEADAAAALNLPLSELRSDYSSGSFSNLRMAWQDAEREYQRRRLWWHRTYRLPKWRGLLSEAFADGRLPRMSAAVMKTLKAPTWPGPKREPPQPEGEAKALKMLVDAGILSPAAAAAQLDGEG